MNLSELPAWFQANYPQPAAEEVIIEACFKNENLIDIPVSEYEALMFAYYEQVANDG